METTQTEFEGSLLKEDLQIIDAIRSALKDLSFGDIEIDIKIGRNFGVIIDSGVAICTKKESKISLFGNPKGLLLSSYSMQKQNV